MSKAREFELDIRSKRLAYIILPEYKTDPKWRWDTYKPIDIVHVIEKSAADKLAEALQTLIHYKGCACNSGEDCCFYCKALEGYRNELILNGST